VAFGRRATIEQPNRILMARHAINQNKAFNLLREHTQRSDRKLIDVAAAIVQGHVLLLPPLAQDDSSDGSCGVRKLVSPANS
jgi:hypothetical protein